MKLFRIFVHITQSGLIYVIYLMNDLYKNHLGFMRNVLFYSHKVNNSAVGSKLFLLPVVLVVIALLLTLKKRTTESFLLVMISGLFLVWQLFFTLEASPIYYLISAVLCLGVLLQLAVVLLMRSSSNGLLK
ncbi:hypothetical protein A5865_001086 [Enterococcus sp. 12E11_DIV0728]|nr:hypothetical protein A5865_001086 [Enterococcus sp. 12E11_DIV0728]OUZ16626.1 hypothetical protein A5868_001548 [Enterococcus sp. 12F9_DIV0723]